MDYLCRRMGIDTQFMLSIHDEVRYMVKEEDQHKAAYALQLSNMWTRAFFSYQVGIPNLPQVKHKHTQFHYFTMILYMT